MKPRPDAPVVVVGRPEGGRAAGPFGLVHGLDPRVLLARRGWDAGRPVHALRNERGQIVLEFAVRPIPPTPEVDATHPAHDADLDLGVGEVPHVHQRVASYAVARSDRGVLLTQLSRQTNAPGLWNLPGGGLDLAEDPLTALKREVLEETSQVVTRPRLFDVQSEHWVGRAPSRRVEDFHAVRIIYLVDVARPSDPVVRDIGGSTEQARWVPLDEVARMPVVPTVRETLRRALTLA